METRRYIEVTTPNRQRTKKLIVKRLKPDVDARKAVIVGFKLGDIYPEKFVYENGDRKGEVGMVIKGRLLKVRFAKVDGVNFVLPARDEGEAVTTAAA